MKGLLLQTRAYVCQTCGEMYPGRKPRLTVSSMGLCRLIHKDPEMWGSMVMAGSVSYRELSVDLTDRQN